MGERLTVIVEDGVSAQLVALAGGSRKQGAYLSRLIDAVARGQQPTDQGDLESLRMTLAGTIGALRQLEARVLSLEQAEKVVII